MTNQPRQPRDNPRGTTGPRQAISGTPAGHRGPHFPGHRRDTARHISRTPRNNNGTPLAHFRTGARTFVPTTGLQSGGSRAASPRPPARTHDTNTKPKPISLCGALRFTAISPSSPPISMGAHLLAQRHSARRLGPGI